MPAAIWAEDSMYDALSEVNKHIPKLLERFQVEEALCFAVRDCKFSVSIADPQLPDVPLIAVSEGFENVTGYALADVQGLNCRFLNEGCEVSEEDFQALRRCSKTGERFVGLLQNRRSTGETFMNLLDLQGLIVARDHSRGGADVMFLVGIQADVTSACDAHHTVPEDHRQALEVVAARMQQELARQLQKLALSAAGEYGGQDPRWEILPQPIWAKDAEPRANLEMSAVPKEQAEACNRCNQPAMSLEPFPGKELSSLLVASVCAAALAYAIFRWQTIRMR
ncbi:unnamed protein product [Effrenium voratum]|uniref:PAS domain-containing protein n=1 Tax=Effrenium voratum TaxID=2562239 RepID=A0AA36I5Z5_9DINO|nr:unnamed protein product [Effrenium voratum]